MSNRIKTALIFAEGGFVGREYFWRLCDADRHPDFLVTVGRISSDSIAREIRRTGGGWNPPSLPRDMVVHHFVGPSDISFVNFIRDSEIDIAIQGGIGILKCEALSAPRIGFVNVHPGQLPEYRGSSCPEWALYNGDPVHATAHFIDEGIDTGPVICRSQYNIHPDWCYEDFRANIYAHCAQVLVQALQWIENAGRSRALSNAATQTTAGARYHQPIPDDKLEHVRSLFAAKGKPAGREEKC